MFEQTFSPLHNRCLLLLSKLLCDGCEGWWDNLYPSLTVTQAVARGGEYEATVPAGPKAGNKEKITVRKTGTSGTTRTNRGIDPACRQPNPKADKLSKKKLEEIKAKPLEERSKSSMTISEPRVLCVSVFDNGPVHMLDSIHTSAGIIEVPKRKFNPATNKRERVPLRVLAIIDEYNHGMQYVDIRDHYSHSYNFDGGFWRDKKWWMPIFKELYKSSCDQGYVCYKRVCDIENEKAVKAAADAKAKAIEETKKAAHEQGVDDDAAALLAAAAAAKVPEPKKIKPMSHLDFLEKIAEGFTIEAYNSTKSRDDMKISLHTYDLATLERAIDEMRGRAPPSKGAQGREAFTGGTPATSGAAGGKTAKRRLTVSSKASHLGLLLPPSFHRLVVSLAGRARRTRPAHCRGARGRAAPTDKWSGCRRQRLDHRSLSNEKHVLRLQVLQDRCDEQGKGVRSEQWRQAKGPCHWQRVLHASFMQAWLSPELRRGRAPPDGAW